MAGTQNQPLEYEQVTYNAPDGARVGNTTSDKLGFFGSTPVLQQSINSAISTTASISTAPYGFATSTEALQIVNAVSTIAYALKQLGLCV